MKHLFYIPLIIGIAWSIPSCKKSSGPTVDPKPQDSIKPKPVVLEDSIARVWIVSEATHNGSPDMSSKGMKFEFYKNGSYFILTSSYEGTWEFIENKTKVLLDKDISAYKTTWKLEKLTSKVMNVTFKSPFTGGSCEWKMIPY